MSVSSRRFRVALSFAGEKRDFVAKVANLLAESLGKEAILYDKFLEAEFARHDLGIYLPELYGEQSDLIVPVLCPDYDPKRWTGWEWLHIYGLLTKADGHRVMPSRFHNATVGGLSPAAGFIELDKKSPRQFAKLILERLATNEGLPRNHYAKTLDIKRVGRGGNIVTPYEYYKSLCDNFSTYENLGLPLPANAAGEADVRIAIRDLFVEPQCSEGRVSPEEFDTARRGGTTPALPLLPILAEEGCRIVLLADPGMGKSTLVQWLITTLAEEAPLPDGAKGLRGAVPLPFVLRDLVAHLPADHKKWDWPSLKQAFTRYHPRSADRPALAAALAADETSFNRLLASNRAFFLIDGLDEIGDPDRRGALRDGLWQGFEAHPDARWLITSRWVGYEQAPVHVAERVLVLESKGLLPYHAYSMVRKTLEVSAGKVIPPPVLTEDFQSLVRFSSRRKSTFSFLKQRLAAATRVRLLYLAPFDDEQQLTFARHWYLPRMGAATGAEHAAQFIAAVQRHSAVRVIGRVPNLLYLLALLYRHRALLPHGRTHVYTAISEAYLGGLDLGIDAARGSIDAAKRLQGRSDHKDKVRLLATIARHMQERRAVKNDEESPGEILVTREELEQWLASYFPDDDGCVALHAFIDYVAARSGLLLPRGEGLFGFAHLSFQEYYAACWLEDEFRRLLNAQARGGGGGFLTRAATAEPAGALSRERFSELAAQTAWREPLVFLVEKLSGSPDDTITLIDWLFPQLSESSQRIPGEATQLLATLSLDPQVALNTEQRRGVWELLWRAHLADDGIDEWNLPSLLLSASEFEPLVWDALLVLQPSSLSLGGSPGIADLSPLSAFTDLRNLYIDGCKGVTDLSPLTQLTSLESLYMDSCTGVADFSPLAQLASLETLSLRECTGITDLSPLAQLASLVNLNLDDCTDIADLSPLTKLTGLESLSLEGCRRITSLSPLTQLSRLGFLSLDRCDGITDLSPLSRLADLRYLYLPECAGVTDLTPISNLCALRTLDLEQCTGLSDLAPVSNLTQLAVLNLDGCPGLDFAPIASLVGLSSLKLDGGASVLDLEMVGRFSELGTLSISGSSERLDLAPLRKLAELTALDLADCTGIEDVAPLAELKGLKRLSLHGCTGVANLEPIATLTQLTYLSLDHCAAVEDLAPLAGLTQLEMLSLNGCTGIRDFSPLTALSQLGGLYIDELEGEALDAAKAFLHDHPNLRRGLAEVVDASSRLVVSGKDDS